MVLKINLNWDISTTYKSWCVYWRLCIQLQASLVSIYRQCFFKLVTLVQMAPDLLSFHLHPFHWTLGASFGAGFWTVRSMLVIHRVKSPIEYWIWLTITKDLLNYVELGCSYTKPLTKDSWQMKRSGVDKIWHEPVRLTEVNQQNSLKDFKACKCTN